MKEYDRLQADLKRFKTEWAQANAGSAYANLIKSQIDLLEDAVIVYHERRPSEEVGLMRFGLSLDAATTIIEHRNKYHGIPASLLVPIFMRKLQDDMDRRRP